MAWIKKWWKIIVELLEAILDVIVWWNVFK